MTPHHSESSAPLLVCSDLRKSYPGSEREAVAGISFEVEPKEIFGFLGPNGAGKTTTLSILATLLSPSAGSVKIGALDVVQNAPEVRRRIGYVPQEIALYPSLTARENLSCFGRLYGLSGTDLRSSITDTLSLVGLADRADDRVDRFSGGMSRRLNLAAGLLHRPDLLLLDEPTVGVDPQSRRFIFDNVQAFADQGMTVLYTTHYMEEAEELCRRLAIIDEGKILVVSSPNELLMTHGEDSLELSLDRPTPSELEEAFLAHPRVDQVSPTKEGLILRGAGFRDNMSELLDILRTSGIQLRSLSLQGTNLERVFLSLTGKKLRD